jgi:hypothetical protein
LVPRLRAVRGARETRVAGQVGSMPRGFDACCASISTASVDSAGWKPF